MKLKVEQTIIEGRELLQEQEFEIGKITLIAGESGVGKTTLLKQLMLRYKCGYVSQDPDNQIVCDKVWHELAFGLENVRTDPGVIRSRVAEVATYLGMESIINKDVSELSGGQKQKVCLASVLCMAPELVLMDEPTAMLDPIASREFWSIVERLSRDRNIRFIIVEHDYSVVSICDKKYTLTQGVLQDYKDVNIEFIIEDNNPEYNICKIGPIRKSYGSNLILNINKLELVNGINGVIGPNGIGKTTLLKMITGGFGEKKLFQGSVMMPQDVKMMFSKETVQQEYGAELPPRLVPFAKTHPLDLSGGEQHILGVYLTLQREASLYCFDEPTKGMDTSTKNEIMEILKDSSKNIVMVSHDLDLVAEYSNKVIFLFNREIANQGTPKQVFSSNLFYRPEAISWI